MSVELDSVVSAMRMKLMEQHEISIAPHDPLLMAMSANLLIVEQAMRVGLEGQQAALSHHRGEMQGLTRQWAAQAQAAADTLVHKVRQAQVEATEAAFQDLCEATLERIGGLLSHHERRLVLATWTVALAVAALLLVSAMGLLRL